MIAYLEGRLVERGEDSCIVLTEGGVGYEVFLPVPVLARLPAKGDPVHFFAATIVREDALELYGFETYDDRRMFEILISISKVGPKVAVSLLSIFSPDDLRRLASGDDPDPLTRVSGIGKKSAEHIFLELKYKLRKQLLPSTGPATGSRAASAFRDALSGLTNLGYREEEARPVLDGIFADEPELDAAGALREALKTLGRARQ